MTPQNLVWPIADVVDCPALDQTPQQDIFRQAAIDYLFRVTNQQFGTYTETIRPCRDMVQERIDAVWSWSWNNVILEDGSVFGLDHGCTGDCACTVDTAHSLWLPGPVVSVDKVMLDGSQFPSSKYDLFGELGNVLVRTDGEDWPATQDLLRPVSEPNTFQVTYTRGTSVPEGGQLAAAYLACEFAKAYKQDNTCQLPRRVQTISRQGVTVGFVDTFEGLGNGKTGIWVIDAWVASVTQPPPIVGVKSVDVCR